MRSKWLYSPEESSRPLFQTAKSRAAARTKGQTCTRGALEQLIAVLKARIAQVKRQADAQRVSNRTKPCPLSDGVAGPWSCPSGTPAGAGGRTAMETQLLEAIS